MANIYKKLRIARIAISILATTAIFVAVAFGYDLWLSRWQIVPALMAGSLSWIVLWVAVTALAGRIYCSTVCPVGTALDVFGHIGHIKKGYFYSAPHTAMRRSICCIAVAAFVIGIPAMFNLLDPAAAFSRIAVWSVGAAIRPMAFSLGAFMVAFATVAIIAATAFSRGRILCNTLCPIGAGMAEISRFSLYHIDINTDKCVGCGLCTARCKAQCIDPDSHTVDASRCVVCFDCTAGCPNSAITYRRGRHRLAMPMMETADTGVSSFESQSTESPAKNTLKPLSRREFLATVVGALPAMAMASDTINPDIQPLNPVHPPGVSSIEDLRLRCTGCGSCSTACPSGIIQPDNSIRWPMRPVLEFKNGPCRYDCTRCTDVCPTSTLKKLTVSEKHIFVIGKARVVPAFCSEYTSGNICGECVRRCPRQAISIVAVDNPQYRQGQTSGEPELTPSGKMRRLPHVNLELCIGCGACRYYCPTRPSAFIVEGIL